MFPGARSSTPPVVESLERSQLLPMSVTEMAPTVPLYHRDTYLFTAEAKVLEVRLSDSAKGKHILVLNQSIFYPQGGGQPSDVGRIRFSSGLEFQVTHGSLNAETGIISHIGNFNDEVSTDSMPGLSVTMQIDKELRLLHARLHTMGHLLDFLMKSNAIKGLEKCSPTGAYTFPAGPYVDYTLPAELDLTTTGIEAIKEHLISTYKALGAVGGMPVIVQEYSAEALEDKMEKWDLSDKARLASYIRVVEFEGAGGKGSSPCGGTHVSHTNELGELLIRKITGKKDVFRIAYTLGV